MPHSVEHQLLDFWNGPAFSNNKWLQDWTMMLYVRRSQRVFRECGEAQFTCLDLANMSVFKTGRGRFTKLLEFVEGQSGLWQAVYVENVMTTRFSSFFVRQGWTCVNDSDPVPSFYRLHPVAADG